MTDLDQNQLERYSRQLLLREIGGAGQRQLLGSSVLLVGAGGLGTPVSLYLAAAGVGRLVIVDGDRVELANLQRQVIHDTPGIGMAKVHSAAAAIQRLNPEVRVEPVDGWLDGDSAPGLLADCGLVVDGSDNFATRHLVNQACLEAGRVLVTGAVVGFEGQITTIRAGVDPTAPCYRCLFPTPPRPGEAPTCTSAGILGPVAGMVGSMLAVEAIKELLGVGTSLSGRLQLINLLDGVFHQVRVQRDPHCPGCGLGTGHSVPERPIHRHANPT